MATNCNCDCFNDVININNKSYNITSGNWVNSYLCDFSTLREDNSDEAAVVNNAYAAQGFSVLNDGKYVLQYLINSVNGADCRVKMVLIDLTTFKIIDSVERNAATDSGAYLNHCNGGTSYRTTAGNDISVVAANGIAFSTAVTGGKISNITTSTVLKRVDDTGHIDNMPDSTFITFDNLTGYWYTGYGGNIYRSVNTSYNALPDTYKYIFNTGFYTTDPRGVQSLRNQGCVTLNQSCAARDGILYSVVTGPAVFIAFNLDSARGDIGDIVAVHNFREFATGYTGAENECLGWSDYTNSWIVNTNGRYVDEYSTDTGTTGKSQKLFNHVALWAVGDTVADNLPQSYSTNSSGTITQLAGNPRYIYCTLDPDIMTADSGGYKIGEYIRHEGYIDRPFRSIGQAFAMVNYLKTQTCHQTVFLIVNGDFAKYLRGLTIQHNASIKMTHNSTLPSLTIQPNNNINIVTCDVNGNDRATNSDGTDIIGRINSLYLHRGAKLTAFQIHISYLEMRAGSILTGNNFGDCRLSASGQSVISVGTAGNNFSGTISKSIAYVGGGYSNLTFDNCVNLSTLTGVLTNGN